MFGNQNDFAVGVILEEREDHYRTDDVRYVKLADTVAHGIDDTGGLVSQTRRKFYRSNVFVIAPHRLSTVDSNCLDLDTNFVWARSGDLRFDEFEDFRPASFRKLDNARHGCLRVWTDVDLTPFVGPGCPAATVRLALCRHRRTVRSR